MWRLSLEICIKNIYNKLFNYINIFCTNSSVYEYTDGKPRPKPFTHSRKIRIICLDNHNVLWEGYDDEFCPFNSLKIKVIERTEKNLTRMWTINEYISEFFDKTPHFLIKKFLCDLKTKLYILFFVKFQKTPHERFINKFGDKELVDSGIIIDKEDYILKKEIKRRTITNGIFLLHHYDHLFYMNDNSVVTVSEDTYNKYSVGDIYKYRKRIIT